MQNENKNILKKNFHDWAIFSMINNTKLRNKTVIGWKIIAGKKVKVEVVFHIIRKFRDEIVIRANGHKNQETLLKMTAGADKLNFYLPDDLVLFQSEIKHTENNGDLRVSIPGMVAQVDRRLDLRLFLDDGMLVQVEFKKDNHLKNGRMQTFKKDCFDLSAGGSSFIISKSEKIFFQKNDILSNVKLYNDDISLNLRAKVVNILEEKPSKQNGLIYQAWKVCLKHEYKSTKDRKKIEDFVFENAKLEQVI